MAPIARYWRFIFYNNRYETEGLQINEFQLWNASEGRKDSGITYTLEDGLISSGSLEDLNDDNIATSLYSDWSYLAISIDFTGEESIDSFKFSSPNNLSRPTEVDIYYSDDGVDWMSFVYKYIEHWAPDDGSLSDLKTLKTHYVSGTVYNSDNAPLDGCTIRVYRRNHWDPVAEFVSGADTPGEYYIELPNYMDEEVNVVCCYSDHDVTKNDLIKRVIPTPLE